MLVILGILIAPFIMLGLLLERKRGGNERRTRWD